MRPKFVSSAVMLSRYYAGRLVNRTGRYEKREVSEIIGIENDRLSSERFNKRIQMDRHGNCCREVR